MGSINSVGEQAAVTDFSIARVKVATGRSEDNWQIVLLSTFLFTYFLQSLFQSFLPVDRDFNHFFLSLQYEILAFIWF